MQLVKMHVSHVKVHRLHVTVSSNLIIDHWIQSQVTDQRDLFTCHGIRPRSHVLGHMSKSMVICHRFKRFDYKSKRFVHEPLNWVMSHMSNAKVTKHRYKRFEHRPLAQITCYGFKKFGHRLLDQVIDHMPKCIGHMSQI